jgi:hypothetical protein
VAVFQNAGMMLLKRWAEKDTTKHEAFFLRIVVMYAVHLERSSTE